MRSRLIAGCAVVAAALGAQGATASATPVLWLKQFSMERAAPGTPAYLSIEIGGECSSFQEGTLVSNGQQSDEVQAAGPSAIYACGSGKLAASISTVVAKAGLHESVTMTTKSVSHVLINPWCVYALPKTISLPAGPVTLAEGNITGTLDKGATFGSCPSTRAMHVAVTVEEAFSSSAFYTEVLD